MVAATCGCITLINLSKIINKNFLQFQFNLKHIALTFHLQLSIHDDETTNVLKFILRHKNSLEELKIIGLPLNDDHHEILNEILSSEKLKSVEFEVCSLMDNLSTLKAVDENKIWKQIEFIDSQKDDEKDIKKIIKNHQKIKSIKFTQKSPLPLTLTALKDISHLEVAIFKFKNEILRSFTDFSNLHELIISRVNNQYQLSKLIEILRLATNLKILKIKNLSTRCGIDSKMRQILLAVKNLEEFHMEAYSKHFDVSLDAIDLIRNEAKKLKKLKIAVADEKLIEMREKLRILSYSEISAVAVEKKIYNTCLESVFMRENFDDDLGGLVKFTM